MFEYFKCRAVSVFRITLALTPLLLAMYLLYWLEKQAVWVPETLHRDKASIALVAVGMTLSFLIYSRLSLQNRR